MKAAQLRTLFAGGQRCIRIISHEEREARDLVLESTGGWGLRLWTWSSSRGLKADLFEDGDCIPATENAGAALWHLARHAEPDSLLVLHDLADHLADPAVLRAWRDLRERLEMHPHQRIFLVMIDHAERVPPVVAAGSTLQRMEPPDDAEVEQIVRRTLSRLNTRVPVRASLQPATFDTIKRHLRGLSRRHIEQVIAEVVAPDLELSEADIPAIIRAKRRAFSEMGVLEFVDAPTSLDEVGGLNHLKAWLAERAGSLSNEAREFGLSPPRGVLLLGVQGAGKSLAAKAIATAWQRPLMRLDPGTLYDRYIGESEKRLCDALRQAEAMSPVVLWIDEIEKGFASAASQSTDGGLSRRMFGSLLTWMQEHSAPVFLVATANDVAALPPELLRKGRFDEIFFVDLPDNDARRSILTVHLARRKQNPAAFDIDGLINACAGFSGAEIEQAVIASLHRAFADKRPLNSARVIDALRATVPLSITMSEQVDALRDWARTRCVMAG